MRSGSRIQAAARGPRRLLLPVACGLALASCAGDRPARPDPVPAAGPLDAQAPPAPPPPPEKAVVPKGCDINLAGRYKLGAKPYWTYLVEDDGVHLVAKRTDLPDAGAVAEPGRQPGLVLDRTARGFVGFELGFAASPSGNRCPVTFRAELTACAPQGLTVRSEDAVSLDDQCRLQRPASAAASEKVLVRQ